MNVFTKSDDERKIRLGLPSKGRMYEETIEFFNRCGLQIKRNNRNYIASIANAANIQVVFQRQEDIVKGVVSGLLDVGIAGYDLISEITSQTDGIYVINNNLGFGKCSLEVAVPEKWNIKSINELENDITFRVASKFHKLTSEFLDNLSIKYEFVEGAGTLEVSPALGNADFIVDLVSTGQTLLDNRLKRLQNGKILESQAAIFTSIKRLQCNSVVRTIKMLLEYIEATLRAEQLISINANIRGEPKKILQLIKTKPLINGLQGPTVSPILSDFEDSWFAIHIIVKKSELPAAISSIRAIGGSGVVVTPVQYVFEEKLETEIDSKLRVKEVNL